jgi:hypothetical protein
MNDNGSTGGERRAFLRLVGGTAVLIPLAGIGACASKESPATAPAASSPPDSPPVAPAPMAQDVAPAATPDQMAPTATAPQPLMAAGDLPHLAESDPVARSLGYHEDSTKIEAAKYPQHQAGQACHKCVQFKGAAGDSWGPCGIFTGKQVNANGWCTAFAAKA